MKKEIEECTKVLKKGGTILYPTDTIWGIGCDATNAGAVSKIYEIKKRMESKSFIVLADSIEMVREYVEELPSMAEPLIEVTDKPLTIIYPAATGLAENIVAPDGSIAIRVVNSEFCMRLIARLGRPIVSTSANISGERSAQSFDEISKIIKESVDYVVDPRFEENSTHKASSIIKLGRGNEIEIIR